MKKIFIMLLTTVIFISLASCVKNETFKDVETLAETIGEVSADSEGDITEAAEEEIRIEEGESITVIYLTKEQIKESLTKVTLTKENWQDYFADYDYTEHIVRKNAFGDIEQEYDQRYCGFGIRRDICAVCNNVAFKFDGQTSIGYDGLTRVLEAGSNIIKYYNENGELVDEREDESRAYFLVEFKRNIEIVGGAMNPFYKDHNCLDVIGEIIVVNLPFDEPYYGFVEFRFPDGKSISGKICYEFLNHFLEE